MTSAQRLIRVTAIILVLNVVLVVVHLTVVGFGGVGGVLAVLVFLAMLLGVLLWRERGAGNNERLGPKRRDANDESPR